jgi:hypothetical protein
MSHPPWKAARIMKFNPTQTASTSSASTGSPAEIVVILDRSGSMQAIASDAIGGFNAFIESQRP